MSITYKNCLLIACLILISLQVTSAFRWGPWKSSCTVTCGIGVKTKLRKCLDNKGNVVRDTTKCAPGSHTKREVCRLAKCTSGYHWGKWHTISGFGFQKRKRVCLDNTNRITKDVTKCGREPDTLMLHFAVFGVDAPAKKWPWQVFIELAEGEDQCGGIVLDENWILSAAHCFSGHSATKVLLGTIYRDGRPDTVTRTVRQTCCHEDFVPGTWENDICLLQLSSPVKMNELIKPATLPAENAHANDNTECTVTGWGLTEEDILPIALQEAKVKVINKNQCIGWYGEIGIQIPRNHFCAGHTEGGADTCHGDSGGPLVCSENNGYTLYGVTSFGSSHCGQKELPGVYTKVSSYINWITKTKSDPCPDHHWGPWKKTCSVTCGQGIERRTRQCLDKNDAPISDVSKCTPGSDTDHGVCDLDDCITYHWGPWGQIACSATCGKGTGIRVRSCLDSANVATEDISKCSPGGGTQRRSCNMADCPNYHWGPWQSTCSVTCGQGVETRTRVCLDDNNRPTPDIQKCAPGQDTAYNSCRMEDCVEYNWGSWENTCSVTCGRGTRTGTRLCLDNNGSAVSDTSKCGPEPALQIRTCNLSACKTYHWGPWADSPCSVTCGQGFENRTRMCLINNGDATKDVSKCGPGSSTESIACRRDDCETYHWGPWRQIACSATCGKGTGTRDRSCLDSRNVATEDISKCSPGGGAQRRPCNMADCPNYHWGPWQSTCSVTCGQGVQTRTRVCLDDNNRPTPDTQKCAPGRDTAYNSCRIDCVDYNWTPWENTCSVTCGRGTETGKRMCLDSNGSPVPDTRKCGPGPALQIRSCNLSACTIAGTSVYSWSAWKPWSTCRVPFGESNACDGMRRRFRLCRYRSQVASGSLCSNSIGGADIESRSCTPANCNSDINENKDGNIWSWLQF